MSQSRWVHLEDCTVRGETDKALLIAYNGEEYWVPRSQIADEGENLNKGDKGVTISITEWIAQQKGIEVDE